MEAIYSNYHPRFLYVDKYRFTSQWVYPTGTAPYALLRYILSGTATFTLNGVDHEVEPDDVFYIPQNSVFSCAAKEELEFISIRFVDSVQSAGTNLLYELWRVPTQRSFRDQPEMKRWFEAVYYSALSRKNFKMLQIRGYLNLIIASLAQTVAQNLDDDASLEDDRRRMEALYDVKSIQLRAARTMKKINDPRILAVEDYIISNPSENLSHEK